VRLWKLMLASLLGLSVLLGGAAAWWLNHALLSDKQSSVDLSIDPGTPPKAIAAAVAEAGVDVNPALLYAWFRASGQARLIKAGSYEITPETTPVSLLRKLVRGEASMLSITLVEGWNIRQVRAALKNAEQLQDSTSGLSEAEFMAALGRPGVHPEGRFYPDTYTYAKRSSDKALLQRALRAMDKRLDKTWAQRAPGSPLKTPQDALILASIVEKETGKPSDRAMISSVFHNRLRIGMPLQTDPTVIYGLGVSFDGNLRKKDLQTDTPWNTYTRGGLPPTPIAMPGQASLLAAVQPANSRALYFVARGDGSSQFSETLQAHNLAVNQFQRGK
jgi:UPF0755 protein